MSPDYNVGQEAFYHDSGEVLKVQVLDVHGNKEFEAYRLKVLGVVQESGIVLPSEVGEEFDCTKRRDASSFGGLWHLMDS